MRKYVRFTLVAYEVTPIGPEGFININTLSKRNLVTRLFDGGEITKRSILELETSIKKYITPELLDGMTKDIEHKE